MSIPLRRVTGWGGALPDRKALKDLLIYAIIFHCLAEKLGYLYVYGCRRISS
jgi:hypothetical protein